MKSTLFPVLSKHLKMRRLLENVIFFIKNRLSQKRYGLIDNRAKAVNRSLVQYGDEAFLFPYPGPGGSSTARIRESRIRNTFNKVNMPNLLLFIYYYYYLIIYFACPAFSMGF